MNIIISVLLSLMAVILTACGITLWKHRNETCDNSRTIQALYCWVSALFAVTFIFRAWSGTSPTDGAFFAPEHTFVPLFFQMAYFLYPMEIIRPVFGRTKAYILLFGPLCILALIGMFGGIEFTPIYSYAELCQHIGEFNVWFRLLTLSVMLFYGFALFLIPYDWEQSSADRYFIRSYAVGVCVIGLLHISIQMSHIQWLSLLHMAVWTAIFVAVTYYEMRERLVVTAPDKEVDEAELRKDKLWIKIINVVEECEGWRNPDLSLTTLSEQIFSNRTYVGDAFKRNTGLTFSEYISKRRIDYVAGELKRNRDTDIQELFRYVGYRQRSTAWKNFHKIMGVSPTEFISGLDSKIDK